MTDLRGVAQIVEIQRRSYAGASAALQSAWPERQALDEADLAGLLGRHRYAVLATARADARPHAAPVSFVVHAGAFWVATVQGLRLRNLRATPWASLVVMEGQRDEDEEGDELMHQAVTAEGPVVLREGDEFGRAFEALREEWLARHGHPPDWATALVELRPQRVFSHASR